jgi:glycosyltransferase involved in cell wall biosynthesis
VRVIHYYRAALSGDFGTAIAVRGWCRALAEAGVEVSLIAEKRADSLRPPRGVELIPLPDARVSRPLPRSLRTRLAGSDVVILHGGWDVQNLMVASQAHRAAVPYIVTAHGVYNPHVFGRGRVLAKRVWWPILEKRYLMRALAVHIFFPDEVRHLAARGLGARVIVSPSGYTAPSGVVRKPQPEPYLLWLGRYDPENKGLDLLLRAVHLLPPADRPRLRLIGVDWRGRRKSVARLAQELGLGPEVSVEGPLQSAAKWEALAGARGFVYPSRWEAFGVAVAEAASIGIPTLVTPFPLGRFLASRGGAILRPPEPAALADGLSRLKDPDAHEIGRRGAEVVREYLSWGRVAGSWRRQFEDILATVERPG